MKTVKELICVCHANFENREQPECLSYLLQEICDGKHNFELDDIIELGALLGRWKKYQHKFSFLMKIQPVQTGISPCLTRQHERLQK